MPIQGNSSLSGGQRQAVGLARVLLQDPPILLLDEPTAAFDQNSEKQVIDYLQKWLGRRTLIITTHKKSVLALVDRAVVLRNGQVIMDGPLNQVVLGNHVQAPQVAEGAGHGS
ncbi:Heterocyst differentiation ATP-binding protein HepA [compost metagenome]